jgi:molybdate transport system substrate-binding protein
MRAAWIFEAGMRVRFGSKNAGREAYATPMSLCRGAVSIFLWLALAGCASRTGPQTLTIAAAADLNFALERISGDFRSAHPEINVEVSYGSSGNYYTQLRNHAPFDLFLSADVEYPRKLAGEGMGVAESLFVYAVGRIVVWVPAGSPLDPAKVLGEASIRGSSIRHLAIANPQHAPYGRAAVAALHSLGAYDSVEKKLVLGENIAQTLQFVESGAADAGIVALSLALAPPLRAKGRYWEIPVTAYPKIEQGGIILKPSRAASEFRSFLMGARGRGILKQYGFSLAGE